MTIKELKETIKKIKKEAKLEAYYENKTIEIIEKLCKKWDLHWEDRSEWSDNGNTYDLSIDFDKKICFSKIHKETVYKVLKILPNTDYTKGAYLFTTGDEKSVPVFFLGEDETIKGSKRYCRYVSTKEMQVYVEQGYLSKEKLSKTEIYNYCKLFGI